MNNHIGHIISGFTWDTSFDDKGKASVLQERLSYWSRIKMQKGITEVFDKVCPPDQVWRIPSLELDLGLIGYGDMEAELSEKLFKALNEKLIDLIIYANKNGGVEMEILDKETSHLGMLTGFLLHGLMPWSYTPVQGSVNQLMAAQLKNNRRKVIAMLREIWGTHEDTRKRIVWQINESNIIKLIEGLEPNNHGEIIEFTNELTEIQQKEIIVQTSMADFKKNLWLWVLNYLLNDRGTIFNRIAFMKSSIRQMADHYNIRYEELLELIERAVDEASERYAVKTDFVSTLKTISRETELSKKKNNPDEQKTNFWQMLEHLFQDPSLRKSKSKKAEFNELVIHLHREDKSKFIALISSLGNAENVWSQAINDLNDSSIEAVFSALSPTRSAILVESIYFINQLASGTSLGVERKTLWKTGADFLLNHTGSSSDNKPFLNYFVSDLSKRKHLSKEHILDELTGVEIPSSAKTVVTLGIYKDLESLFIAEITRNNSGFFASHLEELIDLFGKQLRSLTMDRNVFVQLQHGLIKHIQLNPQRALEVLVQYPDKDMLEKILPYLLNEHAERLLVKNSRGEMSFVLSAVQSVLVELKANRKAGVLAELIQANIMTLGLHAMIFYPGLSPSKFLEFILEELFRLAGVSQSEPFALFVQRLLVHSGIAPFGISGAFVDTINKRYRGTVREFVLEQVNLPVNISQSSWTEAVKMMADHFDEKEFAAWRRAGNKESEAVLNRLLAGGKQFMDTLVKEYTAILSRELKQVSPQEISFLLNDLYWKSILNYNDHNGKSEALKRSFKAAVLFHFPVSEKGARTSAFDVSASLHQSKEKKFELKSGDQLSRNKLFVLIEQAIRSGSGEIYENGTPFQLSELMEIGLQLNPGALRRMMANIPITKKRIEVMNASVSFPGFSMLIWSDSHGIRSEAMEAMGALYDILAHVTSGQLSDTVLNIYWKQAWHLVKTKTWTTANMNKLVRDSLQQVVKETGLNSKSILAELKKKNFRLNPLLIRALTEYSPEFSILAGDEIKKGPGEKLLLASSKGLLDDLAYHLVSRKHIPAWFGRPGEQEVKELLNELVVYYPVKFLFVLKHEVLSEKQMLWLNESLGFSGLIGAIASLNKNNESLLDILGRFYAALGTISVRGISAKQLQHILFRKILKAWTSNNWRLVSTGNIWNELMWDVCVLRGVSKKDFLQDIAKAKLRLPLSLQIAFDSLADQERALVIAPEKEVISKPVKQPVLKQNSSVAKEGIAVRNAGIVLLAGYIPLLFERLGITVNKEFRDAESQSDAVHYLQYVVTGLSATEESLLPLNKVLCGLPLSQPVRDGILISGEHRKIIEGLIKAAIGHWPSIGDTSLNGFRGNWLVRDGLLSEQEDKWQLTVEKRAYDLLIHKSPFSFSIISYPWMNKPLHVTWPY